jgi:hypothetical protein
MESPSQTVLRLLGALEVLYDREAAHIDAGDSAAILATQERSRSVVEGLLSLGGGQVGDHVMAVASRVLSKRRTNHERISARVEELRGRLEGVNAGRRTLTLVGPAYSGGGRRGSRVFAARG